MKLTRAQLNDLWVQATDLADPEEDTLSRHIVIEAMEGGGADSSDPDATVDARRAIESLAKIIEDVESFIDAISLARAR